MNGTPVPQDFERFRYLAPEPRRDKMFPPGFTAPLDFKPTRTLIAERLANLRNTTAVGQILK
jgi:hypothetical protein